MTRVYSFPGKKSFFSGMLSVNLILILINVMFFLIMLFFPSDFILKNIAVSLESVQELRLWTLLTSMFMHGGFFHLFANMISLIFIGGFIEKLIGKKRYFWFYMIAGLVGGLLYVLVEYFFPSGLPAVGASGAIFGVAGLMAVLTPNLP
ncbi:MAG: rhomboid family intramembrane serine protease, partial [Candidatus Pacearchaeota archaeon]